MLRDMQMETHIILRKQMFGIKMAIMKFMGKWMVSGIELVRLIVRLAGLTAKEVVLGRMEMII